MSGVRRKSGCRVFCWGLLFFACLQTGIGVALDRWLPRVRDPEYAAKERKLGTLLAEAPERPVVLALGSSRTLWGLDGGRLSAAAGRPLVFNFGMSGGGPLLELVCWQRLRGAGIRPRLLFVEVLPAVLNQTDDRSLDESWFDGMRLAGDELPEIEPFHSHPGQLLRQWCKARCLPCWRHGEALRDCLAVDMYQSGSPGRSAPVESDAYGWHRHPVSHIGEAERQRLANGARWQYHGVFGGFRLALSSVHALHALLHLCRQDGIPVALVLMPESTAFRALYPPAVRQGLDAFLAEVVREESVPLIDARTWVEDDGFWDGHHLLPDGAAAFSDRFDREALQPLLRRLPHPPGSP
jgi:hypothetical protein